MCPIELVSPRATSSGESPCRCPQPELCPLGEGRAGLSLPVRAGDMGVASVLLTWESLFCVAGCTLGTRSSLFYLLKNSPTESFPGIMEPLECLSSCQCLLLSTGIDGAHGALDAVPSSAFIKSLVVMLDSLCFPRANRCRRANIPWPDVLGNVGVDKARFPWQNFQKIQFHTPRGQ